MAQIQAIVAEQTSRNRFWQPALKPLRVIEMTIRLQIGENEGADVGITSEFESDLPGPWDDTLHQRILDGVHGGLSRVGTSLPEGGIDIRILQLQVPPPLEASSDDDDLRRVGEMLESQTASTVAALWSGILSLSASAA